VLYLVDFNIEIDGKFATKETLKLQGFGQTNNLYCLRSTNYAY